MSRMLQALKKLESRAAWQPEPTAPPGPPPLRRSEKAAFGEIRPRPAVPPGATVESPLAPSGAAVSSVVVEPLPSFLAVLAESSTYAPVFVAETPPVAAFPAAREPAATPGESPPATSVPSTPLAEQPPAPRVVLQPAARQASPLERAVGRTLADVVRGEPFRQAAERLATDAREIAGQTLLLAGVGPLSETHEIVLHLGAALAEQEGTILIVEGDLSRRSLDDGLGLADARGLGDVLRGDCTAAQAIVRTVIDRVAVLPAGRSGLILTATVAEKIPALWKSLADEYRLILIDGGSADDPASATLARLADAAYFVVRLGATEASEAQAALRTFRGASARVLGCIATS